MVSQGICKESRKAWRLEAPSCVSPRSLRGMLRLPRQPQHDGGRHWDSGMRSDESEASKPSGNPTNKANRSLRINRYKIGRHHRGFEAPTRSQTSTPRASPRWAPAILGGSEGAPSSASHLQAIGRPCSGGLRPPKGQPSALTERRYVRLKACLV